ncbi:unnamed protein product [Hapterophycus canaliculatus]
MFRISGGNDKQGFPMKQGVLSANRVRLLMHKAQEEVGARLHRRRRLGRAQPRRHQEGRAGYPRAHRRPGAPPPGPQARQQHPQAVQPRQGRRRAEVRDRPQVREEGQDRDQAPPHPAPHHPHPPPAQARARRGQEDLAGQEPARCVRVCQPVRPAPEGAEGGPPLHDLQEAQLSQGLGQGRRVTLHAFNSASQHG